MEVSYQALSEGALFGIIKEFVTREGTDYGGRVFALDEKVAHVKAQLERGHVKIFYDEDTQTCNLVTLNQLRDALDSESSAEDNEG